MNQTKKSAARIKATALDKMQFQVNAFHDRQCRCIIRFDGKADVSLMERAVGLSLGVAPVLASRYVNHPWRPYWEEFSHQSDALPFRFIEPGEREDSLNRFLSEPMDCTKSPQVDVALIRCDGDTLCVKINHLVADATGLLDYLRILSTLYNSLKTGDGNEMKVRFDGKRGLGQVLRMAGFRQVFKGSMKWNFPVSDWGFPITGSDRSGLAFPYRTIGPDRVAFLKKYCHDHGTKLNVFLLTAYLKALAGILKPSPGARLSVQVTVDLRKYLPAGRVDNICDLSGIFFPVFRYDPGKDFEKLLSEVELVLSRAKSSQLGLGSALFVEIMTSLPGKFQANYARRLMTREQSRGTSHPVFSNLGVIDPGIFSFNGLSVTDLGLFGPVAFPPDFLATIYSFRGRLYINSSFSPTATDPLLVDRFFELFIDYLPD